MASISDACAVAGHEIQITIVPTKNRVGIMIAAGVQLVSNAAAVNESSSRTIAFEELDAVPAYGKEPVAVNEQALRPTPAEARGDDFEAVENTVVVAIDFSPSRGGAFTGSAVVEVCGAACGPETTLTAEGTAPRIDVSPRDVVAACLPDPATLGERMTGRTCAGTWVKGTKDGSAREVYLYHVVDNETTMREYGSQAVVWQTAVNPVVALELLNEGAWQGAGVLGPEAFPPGPFLDRLAALGSPHGVMEVG